MLVRLFKPGERVQLKTGGPIMIVQKYVHEYDPLIGWHENNNAVECTWMDAATGYHKKVFHQKNLIKVSTKVSPKQT